MRTTGRIGFAAAVAVAVLGTAGASALQAQRPAATFEVTFGRDLRAEPVTGRVFVAITRDAGEEPRLQVGGVDGAPFFGLDVSGVRPGQAMRITRATPGYPLPSLDSLPPGDYYVQALLSVYTEFHRADGHVIWAHDDQWEGQRFNRSPGTLLSAVRKVHLDARRGFTVRLALDHVIPPVTVPADDEYVKYEKIQSALLTKFWGRPMYLGAVVLLPRGYAQHPDVKYPGIWWQDHFALRPAFGFTRDSTPETAAQKARRIERTQARESGWEFAKAWMGDAFPRMIAVNILHPTPYYDDSYAVNSENNGPYWDAIHTELMPYLEKKYRLIPESYARVTTGGSTGGWEALALQVFHPDVFGGTWSFYPDPVDFHNYELIDLYADSNAFTVARSEWVRQERPSDRYRDGQHNFTVRQENRLNNVRGSRRRGGENFAIWEAAWGPVGDDGYPKPIWDDATGAIDRDVATYWQEHFDLTAYLRRNWATVGPSLAGKIHVYAGDMDNYFLNLACYRMEELLTSVSNPASGATFQYGRPMKVHGWQPMSWADLVRQMSAHITSRAPAGAPVDSWKY